MEPLIYIGAETVYSPLGETMRGNFEAACEGRSGIRAFPGNGWNGSEVFLSKITDLPAEGKFEALLLRGMEEVLRLTDSAAIFSDRTAVLISSTKGDLDRDLEKPFEAALHALVTRFGLKQRPVVISNACVSGVMAINLAASLLRAGKHDHVVVLGADVLSSFVIYGFQALFAVSDAPCRPFDADRKGVSLGEGCGAVVLSVEKSVFRDTPLRYLAGASSNDANHITGPSRTGEGLVRAVEKTLERARLAKEEIDYVSAHGTGTNFNDEMEAVAFHRLGLQEVPVNSLKGYWGHTLGAAGVMETALVMQCLRNGVLLESKGYAQQGTSLPLRMVTATGPAAITTALKTMSGFGGCNASLLIRKI